MTDQEKIDAVTSRLTGFTPIHIVREEVLQWMKSSSFQHSELTDEELLEGRVTFLSIAGETWKIQNMNWYFLLIEAGL